MKRAFSWIIFHLLIWAAVSVSIAQPPLTVSPLRGNIYQAVGGLGANTGFFIGEKEVLVIDAKMNEESARQMIAEIRKLTANPVSFIILTHSDADHVNGLTAFPPGIPIVAQEKTFLHIAKAATTEKQRAYLPNITFRDRLNLYLQGTAKRPLVELHYFGPAHTDGDLVVYFPEEKVAFLGDLIFIGRDQLIHRAKNGTSFGLVRVLKAVLELDCDLYAHGHGEPITKREIADHLQGIEDRQTRIRQLVGEGKSLEEVKRIFNIVEPPGGARWPSLVEVIYRELTEKKQ